jgi:hypothetical protein
MSNLPKEWTTPLKKLGFKKQRVNFTRSRDDVQQTIFVKRNLYEPTFQIWATVAIRDAYERKDHEWKSVFAGYVCPTALRFFAVNESWWPKEQLPNALEAITAYAVPWLDNHFTAQQLVFDIEQCLSANQSWNYYFENHPDTVRPQGHMYYWASLLHLMVGDKKSSCKRAYQWLAIVKGLKNDEEPGRTIRQMQDMGCEENTLIASLMAQPAPPREPVVARKLDKEFFERLRGEKK